MIPLTEHPVLDARTGYTCVVRNCGENVGNTFWSKLIGIHGIVDRVDADGLITVSLDGGTVVEGVRQSRFTFSSPPYSRLRSPGRRPWWHRLLFLWKR